MSTFSSRHIGLLLLISIVLIGFVLRAYHFSPWLHFELDQARDARVIDHALVEGPGALPLLGPKAGGTFLRLAPGYYYFQYVSGIIFGGTPAGIALLIMLSSVATIAFFFFFIRRYFSLTLSLLLALLLAVSAFFVMYGRFAWNPNILPFFVVGGMYALLRSVDLHEEHRGRFFLLSAFLLTFATHGHFLAFLAVPAITIAFLLIKRPQFSLRVWVGALTIVAILYLPMVLNEIETKGRNTQEFFHAVSEKSTKENHSLAEKFLRDASEHALGALVITTGLESGTFPSISLVPGKPLWTCAEKCDRGKWLGISSMILLIISVFLLVLFWWQEREYRKKDFLLLVGLWFAITFVLFLPLSYGFAPRFFLLSGMIFIVFVGLLLKGVGYLLGGKRAAMLVVFGVVAGLVFSNLFALSQRFSELSRAGQEAIDSKPDRILKERIRVTLEQQNRIIDMFADRYQSNRYPIYMFSEPQHRRALKYLMEKRGIENAVLGFDGIYRQGSYFLVLRAQSDLEDALRKYRASYDVGKMTSFGTLVVIELIPHPEAMIGERQDFSVPGAVDITAPPRYTWKEFFERQKMGPPATLEDGGALEQLEDATSDPIEN